MGEVWRYDGRRVVVTGCSSGIGEATARELVGLGAEVIGLDRQDPAIAIDEFVPVDLSEPESVDDAASRLGSVDALFHCAGIWNGGGSAPEVMRVNFIGLRHLTE